MTPIRMDQFTQKPWMLAQTLKNNQQIFNFCVFFAHIERSKTLEKTALFIDHVLIEIPPLDILLNPLNKVPNLDIVDKIVLNIQ